MSLSLLNLVTPPSCVLAAGGLIRVYCRSVQAAKNPASIAAMFSRANAGYVGFPVSLRKAGFTFVKDTREQPSGGFQANNAWREPLGLFVSIEPTSPLTIGPTHADHSAACRNIGAPFLPPESLFLQYQSLASGRLLALRLLLELNTKKRMNGHPFRAIGGANSAFRRGLSEPLDFNGASEIHLGSADFKPPLEDDPFSNSSKRALFASSPDFVFLSWGKRIGVETPLTNLFTYFPVQASKRITGRKPLAREQSNGEKTQHVQTVSY